MCAARLLNGCWRPPRPLGRGEALHSPTCASRCIPWFVCVFLQCFSCTWKPHLIFWERKSVSTSSESKDGRLERALAHDDMEAVRVRLATNLLAAAEDVGHVGQWRGGHVHLLPGLRAGF